MNSDASGLLFLLVFMAIGFCIYFMPTIIAQRNDHRSEGAILALNLLLGWTFVGWVIALVWALNSGPAQVVVENMDVAPDTDTRACPYCAEPIRVAAIKCKHCGSDLITDPRGLIG